ncbi:DNA translocase FtsK [Xinfangfangia pollutisoli]|uniref:DNA translocase FtsK n=1 Tax=Xinfangfangia pollutisoli TaxID=2865960 RepID=UPI001CD19742|nr:DNA translocase FtsK [Xinfangfangia pollutisoli]
MASYQVRQRDPLLDQGTQAMLERRGRELLGLALIGVALLFALLLGSYSSDDPGWMVATDEPAKNMLGRFGASVASTLVILIGRGAWAIPLIFLAWGLRYTLHRGSERVLARTVFAVIAVALAATYAATLAAPSSWPHAFGLGGLFGDTVAGALLNILPFGPGLALRALSLLTFAAAIAMMLFVTGFDRAELVAIRRALITGSILGYNALAQLMGRGAHSAMRGAVHGARAGAQALADRREARRESAAAQYGYDETMLSEAHAVPVQPAITPGVGRGVIRRSGPAFEATPLAPEPLGAGTGWNAPATLRAEPRHFEPVEDLPKEKLGFLARMRRVVEPQPELIEPILPQALGETDAPQDERIRARISDAIRARARHVPGAAVAAGLTPLQAAIAARRAEPPVMRSAAALRGPAPLVADPRPGSLPPAARAPQRLAEPPVTAPHLPLQAEPQLQPQARAFAPVQTPAYAPDHVPAENMFLAEAPEWDEGLDSDWQVDEAEEDGYAAALSPLPQIPVPDRRAIVQPVVKKAPAPSARAMAEAQPRLRFDDPTPEYELPPLSLLANPVTIQRSQLSDEALEENARMLESVLDDYGVKGEIVSVRPGPVVTMYELEPAPGLKASRVIGLADDIARSMSALSARVSTVPGRSVIGIELPNATREKVVLKEILAARDFGDTNMRLPLALGKDIGGDPIVANLAKMPHLLIAGTTGSGKSVAINTMILSLLYKLTPEECRLIMIDPKMLELSVYDGIPHLLSPVVTDPKKAVVALKWVVGEMEERYRKMSKMGVRNIEGYNGRVREALAKGEMFKRTIQTGFDEETGDPVFETEEYAPVAFPYIVVIVDEMADLMMVAGKEIEACIQRLAQMARASGIHLIMATQRPSVDVITGTIKANFPTRISFQVTSKIDSRTILGEQGAEQLLGQGDMLYMGNGQRITRIHGPFVSDEEVEEIVNHLKSFGPPTYMSGVVEGPDEDKADSIDMVLGLSTGEGGDDALYDQAVAIVAKDRKCSTSYIQRKLGIGYNKAARLVEQMEEEGVVTAANHVGKREILVPEAH